MPFGLKNTRATYQRLVNMMFANQIGKTIEIYIDDILVKSKQSQDHISHLSMTFHILEKYHLKLNPTKCIFGALVGKFLGHLVSQRGIEADPSQMQDFLEMRSPTSKREV